MANKFNYIIVGQGLAGTCLAFHLLQLGQKVLIIDEKREDTSSKIAAGLYNPVTGKLMVLSWKANALFSYLSDFYRSIERKLSSQFLHETTIYRPFVSLEEQNEWMGKSTRADHARFIKKLYSKSAFGDQVFDEFGGVEIVESGYLDIPVFLASARTYFKELGMIMNEKVDYDNLEIGKKVQYKSNEAERIIFCSGTEATLTSYFNWLPFGLVKGEIIEILPESKFDIIYNRGVFIMPRKEGNYVVGATYENRDLTLSITEKGKNTLNEKLRALLKIKYDITGQKAGIRPATRDRRPFVGIHPEFETMGIFNGLGAKGVTLAPFFANQFANFLVHGQDVDMEVNISRYYSLYYS